MLVKFKRDAFLGSMHFKARSYPIEVPDKIDGRPVVPRDMENKPEGAIVLPSTATIIADPAVAAAEKAKAANAQADMPTSMSELNMKKAKPKTFVEATKNDE